MAVIETSYLDQPHSDTRCILYEGGVIEIVDGESGSMVRLNAHATLSLMDFLSGWRSALKMARDEESRKDN